MSEDPAKIVSYETKVAANPAPRFAAVPFMATVEAHSSIHEVLALFPGAQIVEVRKHPPAGETPPSEQVTFQDLWSAAEAERVRAEIAMASCLDRANASDQRSETERDLLRRSAADRRRTAEIFAAMVRMIERVRDSGEIRAELAHINRRLAADVADATDDGKENNAS